ncbi:MAG: DUF4388 domain-containing protein [Deltaproteobacteria bacterium]|nr:DUF4388 domain-containing protein [Deltaproteobacteria bacterium]
MPVGLSGDLKVMPMQDLALYLGNRQLSGTLTLTQGTVKKTASLLEGIVVASSSNDPREYFSQFLINFGYLTEDQLTKAMKTQQETKVSLGKVLLMVNLVTEEKLRTVLQIKARETLLACFRWPAGEFSFDPTPPEPPNESVNGEVPLLDIHREGEFRETAWQAIRSVFPAGDVTIKLDEARLSKEVTGSGSMDQKLFESARDGQTIDEMVFSLHTTDFHLYQRLYALYRQGALAPGPAKKLKRPATSPGLPEAPVETIGEETPMEGMLTHAREFVSSGQYAEADMLIRHILELSPNDAKAAELLREAEAGLHNALAAQLLNPPRVPELAVDSARLRAADLSPPEKYLLSRIDGKRDIRGIIAVAPLKELEALKYFLRFVDAGLVRLRG